MVHGDGNEARYGLLRSLALAFPGEELETFCRESRTTILHHLSLPKEEDADFFVEVARKDGAERFQKLSVSCPLIFNHAPIMFSESFPGWIHSSLV
jgi:hypothetical protein